MPIDRISWARGKGRDIHLLRGQRSRDLSFRSLLFRFADETVDPEWAGEYLNANNDVKLEFRVTFTDNKTPSGDWADFGIRVSSTTGEVSFDVGPAPEHTPTNFIIEAVITENTDGKPHDEIEPARIRVHVHEAATRMWLTPKRLTVRRRTAADPEDTNYRFTVRVEFSDGTVGDLTTDRNVTWEPAANIYSFRGEPGFLHIPRNVEVGTIRITASWASLNDDADMVVAAPWASDPSMPKAELVDGHPDTWADMNNPETVPNVLLFGDGFSGAIADQNAFKAITNKIVHDLKTDPLTRPFDLLAKSMNYWRVAVPSAGRGISVRCEVFYVPYGGQLFVHPGQVFARPVPSARPPPAAGRWTVEHLIYAVGLPLPSDVPATGGATDHRTALRTRWATIARTAPTSDVLSDAVIDDWARMGTRTFIDEIDAFPAMALGEPPSVTDDTDYPLLDLHPDRGGDEGREAFYRALVAANGVAVSGTGPDNRLGGVWAEDRATCRFDNRRLVVVLAAFEGGRANAGERIHMPIKGGRVPILVTLVPDRKALAIDQTAALRTTVDRDEWRAMAHELGHAFGLGDEYVELSGGFTGSEADLKNDANLTSETAVKNDAGDFRSDLIKWNWRRARKAAVIREAIVSSGAAPDFEIKVLPGQAFQFAAGDKVRLRFRTWKTVLDHDPRECSKDFEVVSHNAAGDALTVRLASPSSGPPDANLRLELLFVFRDGSIAYVPVPRPDGAAGEARLIAPKVATYIDVNNRPLTAWPCNPAAQFGYDALGNKRGTSRQLPAFDLFSGLSSGLWSHKYDVKVVGLYSGGSYSSCGIFHPAGFCMMRNSHTGESEFCAVCKFVLVDFIDPSQHASIDRDYDAIYPD